MEGGGGRDILASPAPKAPAPRSGRKHRVSSLVGEGSFCGTGSGNWRPGGGKRCSNTENLLGVSVSRSLRKGVGAFMLVLQLELRSAVSSPPQP